MTSTRQTVINSPPMNDAAQTKSAGQPPLFLGIDVGGTNIKVGVVDDVGTALAFTKIPTDVTKGMDAGLDNMQQAAHDVLAEVGITIDDIAQIGLVTPGPMDIPAGRINKPSNIYTWAFSPVRDIVADRFQRPTILQNDANAAAFGEYWIGRGRDVRSMFMWTLGTGIGSGIIINEQLLEGAHSHGGECGHMIVEPENGRLCGTGQFGTLEAYAGAKALIKRCEEELDKGRSSTLREFQNGESELTPFRMMQAAEQGDDLAEELILEVAYWLGVATVSIMHTIDPEMILLGGAVTFGGHETNIGKKFLRRVQQEVASRSFPILIENTTIDFASLGNDAGFLGAAGCARQAYYRNLNT